MVVTLLVNLFIQVAAKANMSAGLIRTCSIIGLGYGVYTILLISKKLLLTKSIVSLCNNLLLLNPCITISHLILFVNTLLMLSIPIFSKQLRNTTSNTDIFVFMVISTLLGAYLLTLSQHWLVAYLSVSFMTIGSTVLIYGGEARQAKLLASTRYLVYSIVASAIMLVGLSYLYGSTGNLIINYPINYNTGSTSYYFFYSIWHIGFFLGISGLLMISGIFPFQFWIPNVYQPTCFIIIGYLSSISKIAVITFLVQVHQLIISANPLLQVRLESLWAVLAILTMVVGHIGALKASDAKSLLAYGTIAQTGLLLGFVVIDAHNSIAMPYYFIVYTIMNWAGWLGLKLFKNITNSSSIKDYAGLGRQFPTVSICFLITMIASIGLPPTAGFTAKFILLSQLWNKTLNSDNLILTVLFYTSVLGSLLALYYYLKIPYTLFFSSKQSHIRKMERQPLCFIVILLNVLLIGIFLGHNLLNSLLNQLVYK
jgi:NADH-quinone oxidoreductase subunit N